jgi:hypothetical protein
LRRFANTANFGKLVELVVFIEQPGGVVFVSQLELIGQFEQHVVEFIVLDQFQLFELEVAGRERIGRCLGRRRQPAPRGLW